MSLYHLQRQVDSLKRRLPVHYNLARLRPYVEQFCDDWEYCVGMGFEPPPFDSGGPVAAYPPRKSRAKPLMERIRGLGIRSPNWMRIRQYVDNCRDERIYPYPDDILKIALPRAAALHLPPSSPDPITYPVFPGHRPGVGEGDQVDPSNLNAGSHESGSGPRL